MSKSSNTSKLNNFELELRTCEYNFRNYNVGPRYNNDIALMFADEPFEYTGWCQFILLLF